MRRADLTTLVSPDQWSVSRPAPAPTHLALHSLVLAEVASALPLPHGREGQWAEGLFKQLVYIYIVYWLALITWASGHSPGKAPQVMPNFEDQLPEN